MILRHGVLLAPLFVLFLHHATPIGATTNQRQWCFLNNFEDDATADELRLAIKRLESTHRLKSSKEDRLLKSRDHYAAVIRNWVSISSHYKRLSEIFYADVRRAEDPELRTALELASASSIGDIPYEFIFPPEVLSSETLKSLGAYFRKFGRPGTIGDLVFFHQSILSGATQRPLHLWEVDKALRTSIGVGLSAKDESVTEPYLRIQWRVLHRNLGVYLHDIDRLIANAGPLGKIELGRLEHDNIITQPEFSEKQLADLNLIEFARQGSDERDRAAFEQTAKFLWGVARRRKLLLPRVLVGHHSVAGLLRDAASEEVTKALSNGNLPLWIAIQLKEEDLRSTPGFEPEYLSALRGLWAEVNYLAWFHSDRYAEK